MKTEFGLKLWSKDADLLAEAKELVNSGFFQYIELTLVPGVDLSPFVAYSIDYVIHAPHEGLGINIADSSKFSVNRAAIDHCIEAADKLDAGCVVLHPGFGSLADAVSFLEELEDKRILLENMPRFGLGGEPMLGHLPEQVTQLMGDRFGFCFDFGHAIKTAASLGRDYRKLVEEFARLKPSHFHICDGNVGSGLDEHLSFGEGDFDLKYLMGILKKIGGRVTLETAKKGGLQEDRRNAEYLRSLL